VNTIYSDEASSTQEGASEDADELAGLAKDVCTECVEILREPEKSLARPANKVICAFLATTGEFTQPCALKVTDVCNCKASVARYTISQTVPHFIKLFKDPNEVSNRPNVLALLSEVLAAFRDSAAISLSEDKVALLTPHKDEVLGLFVSGLQTVSTRSPAVEGLKILVSIDELLSNEELGFIVLHVNDTLQSSQEDTDDTRFVLVVVSCVIIHL
jgi:DNA repair/transcription protein MET18/MMS19